MVAGAAVAMVGSDVMAWTYSSWGYSSYGSYGSYSSYGSYGSYGRVGPLRRMGARIRARRASRAYYYGSYASYGSYACYGSYGAYPVAYTSVGCCGGYGGEVYYNEVPVDSAPAESTGDPTPADAPVDDSASIQISVPDSAKVYVNNSLTSSTGSSRSFVSRGLRRGLTYSYKLRVEYEQDGRPAVEEKLVKLSAGENVAFSFAGIDQPQRAGVKTELKLEVPGNAQVFLAGAPTHQTGAIRSYATKRLASGEPWEGYTIRVEVEQNGETLVQQRELKIIGGQTYELAFDFDANVDIEATPKLAQLAK